MIKIKPLYTYETSELVPLAGDLVAEFTETGNMYAERDTLQGTEQIHKIYLIYHVMTGLSGRNAELERTIQSLNNKIKEQGIELSKLKRANTSST